MHPFLDTGQPETLHYLVDMRKYIYVYRYGYPEVDSICYIPHILSTLGWLYIMHTESDSPGKYAFLQQCPVAQNTGKETS